MPPEFRETDPPATLYRIGRGSGPLDWPPHRASASPNRFDDPENRFAVLYAAAQRLACFVETLAGFRASVEWLAALQRVRAGDRGDDEPAAGRVPAEWLASRRMARFALEPHQRWLDLRALETRAALRHALAPTLLAREVADFDLGDALSRNRPLTQAMARWAYDRKYHGIVYKSRFDCTFDCWAIFDRASVLSGSHASISADDPALRETARILDLTVG